MEQGYFDLESNTTFSPSGIDIDAILLDVQNKQKLLDENSSKGRAYRWYRAYSDELKDICNDRLAEIDDYE